MRKGNFLLNVRHHTFSSGLEAGIGKRTTGTHYFNIKSRIGAAVLFLLLAAAPSLAQDWIKTGTGLGMEKVRLAVPDFKPSTSDAKNADLLKVFNATCGMTWTMPASSTWPRRVLSSGNSRQSD